MDWFRSYVGTSTDPKFRVVAKKSGARLGDVLAIWQMLLEQACGADERGRVDGFDCEGADALLDLDDGTACAVYAAMEAKGLIKLGRVVVMKGTFPAACRDIDVSSREWSELRACVFSRDAFTCQYCGRIGGRLECDHVVPVSQGGKSVMENLVTACFSCNRSKGGKTLEEWRQ